MGSRGRDSVKVGASGAGLGSGGERVWGRDSIVMVGRLGRDSVVVVRESGGGTL